MQKLVNVEAINLRTEARVAPETLVRTLFLGQAVDDLEDGPEGWHHVRAAVDGKVSEGFIKATLPITKFAWQPQEQPTLRDPATPAREALAAAAVEQWLRFDRGAGIETREPYSGFIGEMWKAFGKPHTGTTTGQPWSAVAISLMVRTAAKQFDGYKAFRQSIGHAAYMWDAIKKSASGDLAAPFWGVRLGQAKPHIGDIVGSWREKPATYDDYLNASKNPEMPSHCDIVVAVGPEVAWAIGGNVRNSVFATGYQLSSDGSLLRNPRINTAGKLVGEAIVLLDNRVS